MHKPLPQAHIIPDNPGADHTTGRTGTTARTSAIVHPPPCSGLCLGTFGRGLRRVAVGHGGLGPGGGTAEKLGREEAGAEVTEGLGRGKAGPRRGRARAGPRRGAGQAGLELGPSWAAERLGREKVGAGGRRGWGGVMPGELLEGDRTPKPAPTVSATKPGEARHRGVRGVVPPGQHCGALGEGRPKGERAAFAAAWGYVDLNHGPRPYQGRALTD